MGSIKETVQVNIQGAILGVQEGTFSFTSEFKNMPAWKRAIILFIAIAIIPVYLGLRIGSEQFLTQKYARQALAAQAAFQTSQAPIVGDMQIIRNPNGTYSGVVLVSNPNLDLAASNISYQASFQDGSKKTVSNTNGSIYLMPNEKKYVVFARIESGSSTVSGGSLILSNVNWQKKLDIPTIKLRASEPLLYDEANPLTFIAEGSIINDSPYQIATARIVFLLYDQNDKIIGVSQRDESRLVPYGRRAYKQLWPGFYQNQIKKVQVIPVTNALDPQNVTIEPEARPSTNINSNSEFDF